MDVFYSYFSCLVYILSFDVDEILFWYFELITFWYVFKKSMNLVNKEITIDVLFLTCARLRKWDNIYLMVIYKSFYDTRSILFISLLWV